MSLKNPYDANLGDELKGVKKVLNQAVKNPLFGKHEHPRTGIIACGDSINSCKDGADGVVAGEPVIPVRKQRLIRSRNFAAKITDDTTQPCHPFLQLATQTIELLG